MTHYTILIIFPIHELLYVPVFILSEKIYTYDLLRLLQQQLTYRTHLYPKGGSWPLAVIALEQIHVSPSTICRKYVLF
jgi:hypothetical protein